MECTCITRISKASKWGKIKIASWVFATGRDQADMNASFVAPKSVFESFVACLIHWD